MSTLYPAPPPPPPPAGPAAAGAPWYKQPGPLFLIGLVIAAAIAIPVVLIVIGGDEEESAASTSTTGAGVTTTAGVTTSIAVTTTAGVTTTTAGVTTTVAATTTTSGDSPCGDPELDSLYADCAAGDMQACDDLFWQSPSGSECEAFGETCGGTTEGGDWCVDATSTTGTGEDVLDYTLEALFAEDIELTGGFGERDFAMQAGGPIDVDELNQPGCTGWATEAPSVEINYIPAGASLLRLYFVADNPGDDTVLVISDPYGAWVCDDDYDYGGGIVDPLVDFTDPEEGTYDIWVASYSTGEIVDGTLIVTEDALSTP